MSHKGDTVCGRSLTIQKGERVFCKGFVIASFDSNEVGHFAVRTKRYKSRHVNIPKRDASYCRLLLIEKK